MRLLLAPIAALVILVGTSGVGAAATQPPRSMAALGDSITRGFNACGWFFDCTARSWSTGTDPTVNSHYLRLLAIQPAISGKKYNDARSGAKMADLNGQAGAAVSQRVQYATILMGANDACTSSQYTMTDTATFQQQFQAALQTLRDGLPKADVFVASIPNVYHLWDIGHINPQAVAAWNALHTCQSMLDNPTSTATIDVERRQNVLNRILEYNSSLQTVCAQFASCRFDGGVVFNYDFGLNLVSRWDYFHPNEAGQAALARETWQVATQQFGW